MRKLAAAAFLTMAFFAPLRQCLAFSVNDTGLETTAFAAKYSTGDNVKNIGTFIGFYIIQPVLGILGLLFLVLMIYAGVLWMTASGNEKRVQKAKDILIAAVIGATIIVGAYAITNALFSALSSGSITGAPATTSTPTP
ncbi:MAG: hypothetical protein WC802_02920 [Patescibacteria group bacterium]|jgi:uncharacterized membrane protein